MCSMSMSAIDAIYTEDSSLVHAVEGEGVVMCETSLTLFSAVEQGVYF